MTAMTANSSVNRKAAQIAALRTLHRMYRGRRVFVRSATMPHARGKTTMVTARSADKTPM
jgi:hypothetical protein